MFQFQQQPNGTSHKQGLATNTQPSSKPKDKDDLFFDFSDEDLKSSDSQSSSNSDNDPSFDFENDFTPSDSPHPGPSSQTQNKPSTLVSTSASDLTGHMSSPLSRSTVPSSQLGGTSSSSTASLTRGGLFGGTAHWRNKTYIGGFDETAILGIESNDSGSDNINSAGHSDGFAKQEIKGLVSISVGHSVGSYRSQDNLAHLLSYSSTKKSGTLSELAPSSPGLFGTSPEEPSSSLPTSMVPGGDTIAPVMPTFATLKPGFK